jgi:hypothetical protein
MIVFMGMNVQMVENAHKERNASLCIRSKEVISKEGYD